MNKHKQATGGTTKPLKNDFKGTPATLHKSASAKPATGMNSARRGKQGQG